MAAGKEPWRPTEHEPQERFEPAKDSSGTITGEPQQLSADQLHQLEDDSQKAAEQGS